MKTRMLNDHDEALLRAAEDLKSGSTLSSSASRGAAARVTALNQRAIYTRRKNDVSRARAVAAEGASISDPQTIYQARKTQGVA